MSSNCSFVSNELIKCVNDTVKHRVLCKLHSRHLSIGLCAIFLVSEIAFATQPLISEMGFRVRNKNIQKVFMGEFVELRNVHPVALKRNYRDLLGNYVYASAHYCGTKTPNGVTMITLSFKGITTNGWGFVIRETDYGTTEAFPVDKKLEPYFRPIYMGRGILDKSPYNSQHLTTTQIDYRNMFSLWGCKSSKINQFQNNLYRAVSNKKSLQEEF